MASEASDTPRNQQRISLNPLTFDEALEGLLAVETPAKNPKRRKTRDTTDIPRASTSRRKRTPKKPTHPKHNKEG